MNQNQLPQPVRVAIDGAQATGKTTLLRQLQAHFGPRLTYIEEASRVIAPEFGVIAKDDWPKLLTNAERLQRFFEREEEWLSCQEEMSGRFVVDSSVYMVHAYRTLFGALAGVHLRNQRYDLVLYCPLIGEGQLDGFRFLEGRDAVDRIYRTVVASHFDGEFIELPAGEQRLQAAAARIEQLLETS